MAGPELLIPELLAVESFDSFTAILEAHPQLLDGSMAAHLETMLEVPGFGTLLGGLAQLLRDAPRDSRQAWDAYESLRAELSARGAELAAESAEIDREMQAGRFDEVVSRVEAALPVADQSGNAPLLGVLLEQRAKALIQGAAGDRSENLEAAIQDLSMALNYSMSDDHTAETSMHLGIAYVDRIREDRAQNLIVGVALFREALALHSQTERPQVRATIQTNLATALLRQEGGDRLANLREAAALCEAALQLRSPEADASEWAYTALNLGSILQDLAALGEVELAEAEAAFQGVIDQADRIERAWLVGNAHYLLGRLWRITTDVSGEDEYIDELQIPPFIGPDGIDNRPVLGKARQQLDSACALLGDGPDRQLLGRALDEFALILVRLDREDEAIAADLQALEFLRPTSAPADCRNAASRLGIMLAKRGDWEGTAAALRDAVEAAELLFHARLDLDAREHQAREATNVARWASFAIARAGDPLEAALVLESGRTRELRRRLGPDAEGLDPDLLPPELATAYENAIAAVSAAPFGRAGAATSRALHEVIAQIRSQPGLDDFATGARLADLDGAAQPGWPLVYVNPTPHGTLLLMLGDEGGETRVDSRILEAPRSLEVFKRLVLGDAWEVTDPDTLEGEAASYLAGIGAFDGGQQLTEEILERRSRQLRAGLDQILPWLGEVIAAPLQEWLEPLGAEGVTLVPCGPLGLAPLHAAYLPGADPRPLIGELAVRYAPSALLAKAADQRAADRSPAGLDLVALADPNENLPATTPEVDAIAGRFPGGGVTRAERRAADAEFLRRHGADATYLHFACHARGGMIDPGESGIQLADQFVSADEIGALGGLGGRLTVVSACQSAVADITEMPDEVFSISTALLGIGAACVIASLWPVDDAATAILMTRLYEEMIDNACEPAVALANAQLWLRQLTEAQESAYLAAYPSLEAELRRRLAAGEPPGRRGVGTGSGSGAESIRPYEHPDYWAAFIPVGA